MPYIDIKENTVAPGEILRKLRLEDDPDDMELIEDMLNEANGIASPKAYYKESRIDDVYFDRIVIDGVAVMSGFAASKLKDCTIVYPYCSSCGTELEEWSKAYTDPVESYFADQIKELFLYKAMAALKKEISLISPGLSSLNPGSLKGWPVSGQKELFAILKGCDCGITVTDSFLLLPVKSASGIFFNSAEHFENCQLCPMKNCPNRRAPFSGRLSV